MRRQSMALFLCVFFSYTWIAPGHARSDDCLSSPAPIGVSVEPRFADNQDGTVTDLLTGLIWLQDANCFGRMPWADGLVVSNTLADGDCGLTDGSMAGDWRLPNIRELYSLFLPDFSFDRVPALPADHPFSGVQSLFYWSATTSVSTPQPTAWSVFSPLGAPLRNAKSLDGIIFVWPVRTTVQSWDEDDEDEDGDEDDDEGNDCPATPAPVAATGQTECWDEFGIPIGCFGTGQDGEYQNGVSVDPRFTDNLNGTVTDNLTGLTWLQTANCFGQTSWAEALAASNDLMDGFCGLTDGSVVGDWRFPSVRELHSLIDFSQEFPALPFDHPFFDLQGLSYWSSTSQGSLSLVMDLSGSFHYRNKSNDLTVSWPVRGGCDD